MEFRLAEILGLPVSAMKSVVSVSEFNKWVKYFAQKPPDINEIQTAVLSTLVSNGLGGKAKVDNFILSGKNGKVKKKDPNQVANEFKSAFRSML